MVIMFIAVVLLVAVHGNDGIAVVMVVAVVLLVACSGIIILYW